MVACRLPIALPGLSHSIAVAARSVALRAFVDGYQYEAKILFVLGWMQIQGSKLECAWGRTHVRSHHMSSAADAVGAPAKHKNKKMPAIIYSPT